MKTINWGIIGVGDVTEVKSGPAFNKVENSKIYMVMRRDPDKLKDYARRHKIPKYTNNADELINSPEIDAVYIATPPSSHAEYTIKAAQAKKHVYVEKPMATSHAECRKMIEVCEANGVKLFVAYYRRELDYFKKIKQLIEEKTIGDIKFVDIKLLWPPNNDDYSKENLPWRVNPEIAGAGYFYDLASHQFDFLNYLWAAGLIIFTKTIIPPISLGELGIREGASIYFITQMSGTAAVGFNASIFLFIINLLIPALIGVGMSFTKK